MPFSGSFGAGSLAQSSFSTRPTSSREEQLRRLLAGGTAQSQPLPQAPAPPPRRRSNPQANLQNIEGIARTIDEKFDTNLVGGFEETFGATPANIRQAAGDKVTEVVGQLGSKAAGQLSTSLAANPGIAAAPTALKPAAIGAHGLQSLGAGGQALGSGIANTANVLGSAVSGATSALPAGLSTVGSAVGGGLSTLGAGVGAGVGAAGSAVSGLGSGIMSLLALL